MEILDTYRKQNANPLRSATVKLEQNHINALRKYDINLGALVRDMLNSSDLMQKYNSENGIVDMPTVVPNVIKNEANEKFNENQYKFSREGKSYYYADAKTMFEKNAEGVVTKISKSTYYKQSELLKNGATK